MINIVIVNYNTQQLLDCAIRSINKTTKDANIYVFDNSDREPYFNTFKNVSVIDNTSGKYIDFDEFFKKYPNKSKSPGYREGAFGISARHCYSVEKCMELLDDDFVLLDSDVLVKKDLNLLVDKSCIFVGDVITQPSSVIKRVLPFVCYINVNMCKQNNIHYFYEDYMHGLCKTDINKDGDKYDTGGGFFMNASKFNYKTITHTDFVEHFKGGSWEDKKPKKYSSHKEFLLCNKNLWYTKPKKVIYTCISGNYDTLKEPTYINYDYDHICFTDQNFKSDIWEIRKIPESLSYLSQVKRQRCIKINAHKFLPDYETSIWVDGNVEILGNVNEYIEKNCDTENFSVFVGKHPKRNCIYDEAIACIGLKKDAEEIINKQMDRYRREGFPHNYGLQQANIIIRNHNNKSCIELMDKWWEEVEKESHRDQLSLSYAIWTTKTKTFFYLNDDIFDNEYFRWGITHGKKITKETNNRKKVSYSSNLILE